MLRSAWLALNLFVATVLIGFLTMAGPLVRARSGFYQWAARTWSGWLLLANGTEVDLIGVENVAPDRPQVIVANHVSWFDVLAIAAVLPKRCRFVAKEELGRVPIFGAAWKAAGHIAVNRRDTQAAIAALEQAGRMMHDDKSALVIFPEGTRSPDGELLPFKKGAFMLALAAGTEIVPAAVSGTRRMLPKGGWRVRGGRITLRFAPPIQPADYGEGNRDELIADVRAQIAAMLAQAQPRVEGT